APDQSRSLPWGTSIAVSFVLLLTFPSIVQADQRTGVGNPQPARLNLQQHLKPAELLLAHRHHRHRTPPGTPRAGECLLNFAEVCHLYNALTSKSRIRRIPEKLDARKAPGYVERDF